MATAVQVLRRSPFTLSALGSFSNADLLHEAARLLGYTPKALLERQQNLTRVVNERALAQALTALDIEPFNLASVQAYKAKKLKAALSEASPAFLRWMHRSGQRSYDMRRGEMTVFITFIVSLVVSLATIIATAVWAGETHLWLFRSYPAWAWAFFGMWGLHGLLMLARHCPAHDVQASWNVHNVGNYGEAIPDFAVQRMLSLTKELPGVTFSIEQLNASKHQYGVEKHEPLPPDPFLIGTYKGISVYLDVWDEPAFEGRRSV